MNIYIHIKNKIINFINNDEYYKNKFNHHNQKYKLEELLDAVIIILRKNIKNNLYFGINYSLYFFIILWHKDISKYVKINWNILKENFFIKKFSFNKYNLSISY